MAGSSFPKGILSGVSGPKWVDLTFWVFRAAQGPRFDLEIQVLGAGEAYVGVLFGFSLVLRNGPIDRAAHAPGHDLHASSLFCCAPSMIGGVFHRALVM